MSSGESKSRRTPSGETIAILFFEAITSRTRKVIICILGGHLRKLACITGVILSRLSGEERRARNARAPDTRDGGFASSPPVMQGMEGLAWVASVSVRFRSKERGTRVKDRAKNGASKRAGRGWGRKEGPSFPFPSPLFHFLALVSFLARPKPRIPFLGLSLLRNQTETLATQAIRGT